MLQRYRYEIRLLMGLAIIASLISLRLWMVNQGDGVTYSASRTINTPIDRLWTLVTAPTTRPRWTTGLLSVDVLTGSADQMGSTALAFHQIGRDRWQVDERLIIYNPPGQWVIERQSDRAKEVIEIQLDAVGSQTRITLRAKAYFSSTFDRFFDFWKAAEETDEWEKSLDRLADLALDMSPGSQPST